MQVNQQEQLYGCPICSEVFSQPITLLCGHTFCRGCLVMAVRNAPLCPLCREVVLGNPEQMNQNIILKDIISRKFPCRNKEEYKETKKTKIQQGIQKQIFKGIVTIQILNNAIPVPCSKTIIKFNTLHIQFISKTVIAQLQQTSHPSFFTSLDKAIIGTLSNITPTYRNNYSAVFQSKSIVQIQKLNHLQEFGQDLPDLYLADGWIWKYIQYPSEDKLLPFRTLLNKIFVPTNPNYAILKKQYQQRFSFNFGNNIEQLYCAITLLKMSRGQRLQLVFSESNEFRLIKILQMSQKYLQIIQRQPNAMVLQVSNVISNRYILMFVTIVLLVYWFSRQT